MSNGQNWGNTSQQRVLEPQAGSSRDIALAVHWEFAQEEISFAFFHWINCDSDDGCTFLGGIEDSKGVADLEYCLKILVGLFEDGIEVVVGVLEADIDGMKGRQVHLLNIRFADSSKFPH